MWVVRVLEMLARLTDLLLSAGVSLDTVYRAEKRGTAANCQKCSRNSLEECLVRSCTSAHYPVDDVSLHLLQESARQEEYSARWLRLDADTRAKIKNDTLETLRSPNARAGSVASQVVAAIAAVELPAGEWPEVIGRLLQDMQTYDSVTLKVSTLQSIGYICETIVR